MLNKGLTEDGAAQALGWPKARVTARVKLLELPEKARELVGTGVIPLSAVDQLRAIGTVSPQLLEVLIDYLDGDQDGHTWAASQLVSDPGYVLGNALRESNSKVFAAYLQQLPSGAVDELRLGKKATEQLAEAEKLHRQINQYAYGPPPIRFTEQDVDQARAAGVVIELDHSTPIIVDRPLYRELAKGAVMRTVEELREQAERAKTERKQSASRRNGSKPEDPAEGARREHGRRVRELAEQAHGANLDLGWALMNNLATVDPEDTTVAKFFVFGLLGGDYDGSPYTQSGDLVAELAVRGIRLVMLPLTLVSNVKRCLERQFRMCKAVWNGRRRIPETLGKLLVRRVLNLARSMREPGAVQGFRFRGIAIVSAGDARPLVRRRSARPEEPHQFVKAIRCGSSVTVVRTRLRGGRQGRVAGESVIALIRSDNPCRPVWFGSVTLGTDGGFRR